MPFEEYDPNPPFQLTLTEKVAHREKVLHRTLSREEYENMLRQHLEDNRLTKEERSRVAQQRHKNYVHGTKNRLLAQEAYQLAEKCDLVMAMDVLAQGIKDGHEFGYNTLHAIDYIMHEVGCVPPIITPSEIDIPLVNLDLEGYEKHVRSTKLKEEVDEGDLFKAMFQLLLADDHGACILKRARVTNSRGPRGKLDDSQTIFDDDCYQDRKWFLYDSIQARGGHLKKRRRVH